MSKVMDQIDRLPDMLWALVIYAIAMAPFGLVAWLLFAVL